MDMFDSDLADLGRSTQYVESDRREHCVLLNPRQNLNRVLVLLLLLVTAICVKEFYLKP